MARCCLTDYMKTKLAILAAIFLAAIHAQTASVRLTWDPNPPEDQVTGYKVYWSTVSGIYDGVPDTIGNRTAHTLSELAPGRTYYFVVTAYNSAGESGYSNEQTVVIPDIPGAVINLQIDR